MVCIQKVGLLLREAPSMTPYSTSPNRHMGSSRVEWQIVREVVTKFSISSKCGAVGTRWSVGRDATPQDLRFFCGLISLIFSRKKYPTERDLMKTHLSRKLFHMVWNPCLLGCFPWDEVFTLKSDVWSRYLSSHVHPFVSMRIIVIYPSQATSTAQSSSAAVTKRFVLLSFVWWWCLQS